MSISINGSTGISGVDGSAATPALQGGDTNTGISFGTDEVRINTDGTQRVVVDASGRLGLGTSTARAGLTVARGSNGIPAVGTTDGSAVFSNAQDLATYGLVLGAATTGKGYIQVQSTNGTSDVYDLLLQPNGANVGIGTTSPAEKFHVSGGPLLVDGQLASIRADSTAIDYYNGGARIWAMGPNASTVGEIVFLQNTSTANVYASKFDSSGRLLVGTTTSQGSYNLQCFGTGVWGQGAYVNGSDASLKDNVQDLESALDVVKAMRPVTFQYKSEYSQDTSTQSGFIAQELQQAMQGKQYLDGIVKPGTNHLNVAYQGIIAVLVKAVQELEAEVQALKGGN